MDEDLLNQINSVTNNDASSAPASAPVSSVPVEPVLPPDPTPAPFQPSPATTPTKSSKKNPLLIVLLTILIIGVIAAGVVCSIIFFGPHETNTPSPEDEDPYLGETEITDEETRNTLKNKVANLFNQKIGSENFIVRNDSFSDISLYKEGTILFDYAVSTSINTLNETLVTPVSPEIAPTISSILSEKGYVGFDISTIKTVPADAVVAQYYNVFGITLNKTDVDSGPYLYNSDYDLIFSTPSEAPTESPIIRYYFINSYTEKGDTVYVRISAAEYDTNEGKVYCGLYNVDLDEGPLPEVCENITPEEGDDNPLDDFSLNESNYQDYIEARFEFSRENDNEYVYIGSYYDTAD